MNVRIALLAFCLAAMLGSTASAAYLDTESLWSQDWEGISLGPLADGTDGWSPVTGNVGIATGDLGGGGSNVLQIGESGSGTDSWARYDNTTQVQPDPTSKQLKLEYDFQLVDASLARMAFNQRNGGIEAGVQAVMSGDSWYFQVGSSDVSWTTVASGLTPNENYHVQLVFDLDQPRQTATIWDGVGTLLGSANGPTVKDYQPSGTMMFMQVRNESGGVALYDNITIVPTIEEDPSPDVELTVGADASIAYRPDLQTLNAGAATRASVGTGGDPDDYQNELLRFDFSELAGQLADGPGTLKINQAPGYLPKNFDGQTVDLYLMPLNNADWEEGSGQMQTVAGAAWNRRKGEYSTSPSDEDKWLPAGNNDPQYGLALLGSHTYSDSEGSASIEFTIAEADLNQWISDGVVSFMLRSDSAIDELLGGTLFQRTWYMSTLQTGDGSLAATLSFDLKSQLIPGDFNGDNAVDVSDLGILATNYGALSGMTLQDGDANGDGAVDVSDLGILATNYGTGTATAGAVPEPAVFTLLICAIPALSFFRRRK